MAGPTDAREALTGAFSFYRRFTPEERERFDAQVAEFIASKRFVSDGEPVDERTTLFVAALACRLTVNLIGEQYTRLGVVNVVDDLPPNSEHGGRVIGVTTGSMVSAVSFTRAALAAAFCEDDDGHNVVYHELAHVLDGADGVSDGIPPLLLDPREHDAWRRVIEQELARLRAARDMNIPTALNPYGAKNEAELFAVATEAFFERPEKLRNAHPELYALMAAFYRQDPAR